MSTAAKSKTKALSRQQANFGRGCLFVFFSIFFIAGLVAFYFTFYRPVIGIWSARSWREVPCVVRSSSVEISHGDDGDTFRVKIVFQYEFDGRTYTSERYGFSEMSTSGRSGKQAIVNRYPAGTKATCFVNPDQPEMAVINRDFTSDIWFGLFPLIFLLVGAGGMLGSWLYRPKPKKTVAADAWMPTDHSAAPQMTGYHSAAAVLELKPKSTRLGRFIGIVLISLFWNGIVGVFVGVFINSLLKGNAQWFLGLFLIPFVLIGLVLLVMVVHAFLGIFNPRPAVTLLRHPVILGETLEIRWQFEGRTSSIQHLEIFLEGQESATYRRGTTTHTDTHTFAKLSLVDERDPHAIASGSASISIPARTMHSFRSSHNNINWLICVTGEIARWPDVDEKFPVVVQPPVVLEPDSEE